MSDRELGGMIISKDFYFCVAVMLMAMIIEKEMTIYRYQKVFNKCSPDYAADPLIFPFQATVQKIITEILHADSGMTFAKETRDLLIECCVEFIRLISSEANEIAEKEAKKTIACEHVKAALEELGFGDYIDAISGVASDYRKQQVVRCICYTITRRGANTGFAES